MTFMLLLIVIAAAALIISAIVEESYSSGRSRGRWESGFYDKKDDRK